MHRNAQNLNKKQECKEMVNDYSKDRNPLKINIQVLLPLEICLPTLI